MEQTVRLRLVSAATRRLGARVDPAALSAGGLTFGLVTFLALHDGGYDEILRSEVGVAVWWIVLLTALAGLKPGRIGAAGWVTVGLLAAFATWTGMALGWSVSAGDTMTEFAREATYLGFLVLAIALQGRAAARHTVAGLTAAISLATVLAVLSRLHPQWFPAGDQYRFLGAGAVRRLSYPINYWNALAAFAAIGVPLLVSTALTARRIATRACATAVLPLSVLCLYLTESRGGVLELAVGLAVLLVLCPRRLEALGTLTTGAVGGAILVWAASDRGALRSGARSAAAIHAGAAVIGIAIVACAGVALIAVTQALLTRYLARPRLLTATRRQTIRRTSVALAVLATVGVAAGAPGTMVAQWDRFKAPPAAGPAVSSATLFSRLQAVNGSGRYQYWQAAVHANASAPWTGTGPGTFRYWWAAHATTDGSVLNAHSLYMETLAETGLVGLAILLSLLLAVAVTAVRRTLDASAPVGLRLTLAGATAALATFLTAAAVEWVWQLAAIAAAALSLMAVLVAGQAERPMPVLASRPRRALLVALAIGALATIAIPLAGALAVRQSQTAAATGDLAAAYAASVRATALEPYAAAPRLQEALVLEAQGRLAAAAVQASAATRAAATDWQTWLTLAQIEARRGDLAPALTALRHARALNPRSALFA